MSNKTGIGQVILAGAGPGDPDLITLKLQKSLREAEVIITDRLVNPIIIEQHANPGALILFAGKQGFNDASFTQEEVTALIIKHALEGKRVLRVKGGDVAFFSNVLDELEALTQHRIPFEIIPGITAASGASAYAGIPLTARDHAQGVQFLTFNPNSSYDAGKWEQLVATSDTLVFYMASKNLTQLVKTLLIYKKNPDTNIAVIEQATTTQQKTHTSTLSDYVKDFAEKQFGSPSLVIIGKVVSLHDTFGWFKPSDSGSSFPEIKQKAFSF